MLLKVGMQFHLPIALRDSASYRVGYSETVVITEEGYEQFAQFERQLIRCCGRMIHDKNMSSGVLEDIAEMALREEEEGVSEQIHPMEARE